MTETLESVLVANRGEIARRVFRSARAMGMRTIAVYVDADADAPFVIDADEAVRLDDGGYLDGAAVVAAAIASGASAVHPGYGFLSENASFAAAVVEAGLTWVGPTPDVIESMGDKLAAKRIAVDVGVPTLPSSDDPTAGDEVGYPLLVKAAAGGGGKGMRIVESAAELDEAVAAAQREAKNAFGDDRVFLERYVERARHVEIQILGDDHGNLIHLGERECSIQRRHQKVIEESPSPVIDDELRSAMGSAALSLAGALGYRSAGTVEFLFDDDSREFFFLEVNTRLQVEHPVTEEVTGIDLVRAQLRVAAGEVLDVDQDSLSFSGHAIEARLYAEDPVAGFLPATGRLAAYTEPTDPAVRWDSGVAAGSVVSVHFDPMLAKVVAHAPTRTEAASRLALALERLHLGGVVTNRDFLVATLRDEQFLAADTTTDFIERVAPARSMPIEADQKRRAAVAVSLWLQGRNRREAVSVDGLPTGWRNSPMPPQAVTLRHGDEDIEVTYAANRDGSFTVGEGTARVHDWTESSIDVDIDGRRMRSTVTCDGDAVHVQVARGTLSFDIVPRFVPPGAEDVGGGLNAPMPGAVLDVRCEVGASVEARQVLVVLEAMKMEHHVAAPFDGTVTEIRVSAGDQVDNGALLLVIEPADGGDE